MLNNPLVAALDYASRGIPTFPCDITKRPVIAGGFKGATTDPDALRRMFTIPGAALIAVPTGQVSGVDILDIDPRHGGHDWLAENVRNLPETRTHGTPSGGRHLLFRTEPCVRNSAGRIAPGVDVRGTGGYAIVPPSPGYVVINAAPVRPWPSWLLRPGLALPPVAPERPVSPAPAEPIGDRRVSGFIDALLHRLSHAPDGAKHAALIRTGRALGGVVDTAGMTETEAVERLVTALPDTVRDWNAARKTAAWAVARGRECPIRLADRPMTGGMR
jgi:hypothetical protein